MESKYLILFPAPKPYAGKLMDLMDTVALRTGLPTPHKKLPPHVTFHRPITGIAEEVILDLTKSVALRSRQTRVTVSHLFNFGKQYIVLPVHATRSVASFWVAITEVLAMRPEYRHGEFDHDNTLHITIAEKVAPVFDRTWPTVRNMFHEEMNIPMQSVELFRKCSGSNWEKIENFPIPR